MITTLHLGLSYNCNLCCSHCYVKRDKDILSISQYEQIIDFLSDKGLLMVLYTFGEPLMSEKLAKIALYVKSHSISQTVLTNGWFLNSSTLDMLLSCGISRFMISLDSASAEKHDENRGVSGAFTRAISAIELLVDRGVNVGIGCTITEKNQDFLNDIFSLAKSKKVNWVSFLAERSNGKLSKNISKQYFNLFEEIVQNKETDVKCFFHDPRLLQYLETMYSEGLIDDVSFQRWVEMNSCHKSFSISVEPNGRVNRCNLCPDDNYYIIQQDSDISQVLQQLIGDPLYEKHFICCPMFSGEH